MDYCGSVISTNFYDFYCEENLTLVCVCVCVGGERVFQPTQAMAFVTGLRQVDFAIAA